MKTRACGLHDLAARCVAIAFALGAPFVPAHAALPTETVIIDAARGRKFDGFGVNLFLAPGSTDARDALMRDLRTRFAEINLFRKLPDAAVIEPQTAAALAGCLIATEGDDEAKHVDAFRAEMAALGIAIHLVYRKYPEPWIERSGTANGHADWRLVPEHIPDLARWIAAELLWAAHHGIAPAAIEIAGEPDGTWNALVTPAEYDRLLVATRAEMDAAGLHAIGIEGPGTSKIWTAPPYLEALQRAGHLRMLSAITLHDYDMIRAPPPAGLTTLPPDARAGLGNLPLAVTEFGVLGARWSQPPFDAGPERRGGRHPATASVDYGVATAAEALRLISDGAASIYAWELEDHAWEDLSMGLLDLRGQRRPAAAALQTFLGLLAPGSTAVPAQGAGPGLGAAGFQTPDGPLFVFANLGPAPRSIVLRIANFTPAPSRLGLLSAYPPTARMSGGAFLADEIRLDLPSSTMVVLRGS